GICDQLRPRVTLERRAWLSLAVLAMVMGALLFVPAGTLRVWQAWIYLALFHGLSPVITRDLIRPDPAPLARPPKGRATAEPRPLQRFLMLGASLGFIGLLIIPALDFRFGWSHVPLGGVVAGDVLFVLGFSFIGRVYRENPYTAATITVAPDQRVISTGPYASVRHPSYTGGLAYVLGTPLALGSYVGCLAFGFMLPFLIWRLLDEERLLARELPGYAEYQASVRYRLLPYVW